MACAICLEELNKNSCVFCCASYHKNCILKALKISGNCPICRQKYQSIHQKLTEKDYNNIEQIRNELHEENQKAILETIQSLENITFDFGTRIANLENMISKTRQNKRIDKLEKNFLKFHEDNLKNNDIQYRNFR
jgi:uncharacterized Zn finger protein (UPF0148 family)